jgi:hypothetical protein
MTAPDAIRLDDADNVATAVRVLQPGDTVLGVTLSERVPRGHKLALSSIARGSRWSSTASSLATPRLISPGQPMFTRIIFPSRRRRPSMNSLPM